MTDSKTVQLYGGRHDGKYVLVPTSDGEPVTYININSPAVIVARVGGDEYHLTMEHNIFAIYALAKRVNVIGNHWAYLFDGMQLAQGSSLCFGEEFLVQAPPSGDAL